MDSNISASSAASSPDISDLLGRVRRHWWLAALCTLAGVGGAMAFTAQQPKVYEAATSVLVQSTGTGDDSSVSGGRTKGDLNLDTEAQLVHSTAIATGAGKLLRSPLPPSDLSANVKVEVPANTSVLVITYLADSPRGAQTGSHAFAQAYLENRQNSATADINGQLATLDAKLQQLNAQLTQINAQLATASPNSSAKANLDSQRTTTISQINSLTGRMNQLQTTTVTGGKIISDANLPLTPTKPNVPLNLASGAMVGLLLGAGAALLRQRLDRRVRRPADLARRTDLQVLAALTGRVRPPLDDVYPPFGPGGRIFNRLRNEVLASLDLFGPSHLLGPGAEGGGRVIVVTGASGGISATLVAANLAAAFARTGSETVLVAAQLPESIVDAATVSSLLGVAPMPGLSDVLSRRVTLDGAIQRAPRIPWLQVITTGGTASAGGLLHAHGLRPLLAELRERADYIVVEAPSTSTSADAQSLASLSDAAIITVELKRSRFADVTDAVEQLRRVATPVLGVVAISKVNGPGTGLDAPADFMPAHDEDDDADPTTQIPRVPASGETRPGRTVSTAEADRGRPTPSRPRRGGTTPAAAPVSPPPAGAASNPVPAASPAGAASAGAASAGAQAGGQGAVRSSGEDTVVLARLDAAALEAIERTRLRVSANRGPAVAGAGAAQKPANKPAAAQPASPTSPASPATPVTPAPTVDAARAAGQPQNANERRAQQQAAQRASAQQQAALRAAQQRAEQRRAATDSRSASGGRAGSTSAAGGESAEKSGAADETREMGVIGPAIVPPGDVAGKVKQSKGARTDASGERR